MLNVILPSFLLFTHAFAAEPPTFQQIIGAIPKPLIDLVDTFNSIRVDLSNSEIIKKAAELVPQSGEDIKNAVQQTTNVFTRINAWLKEKVGLNIVKVLKTIGDLFIWIFEAIVKLVRWGLGYL